MFKPFKPLTIRARLWLVALIPLLALSFVIAQSISQHYGSHVKSLRVESALSESLVLADLLRALQDERGLSMGFTASLGSRFRSILAEKRRATDRVVAEYLAQLAQWNWLQGPSAPHHRAIRDLVQRLPDERDRIDDMDAEGGFDFYSNIVRGGLEVADQLVTVGRDSNFIRHAQAHALMLEIIEASAQERGLLTGVFSGRDIELNQYAELQKLRGIEENAQRLFEGIAPDGLVGELRDPRFERMEERYRELRSAASDRVQRNVLLNELQANIGYGGAIHHFKNFVLRGKVNHYNRFHYYLHGLRGVLDKFRALEDVTAKDLEQLEVIERTFDSYRDQLSSIEEMWAAGVSIADIDDLVEVDDAPALQAIGQLRKGIGDVDPAEWWRLASSRLESFDALAKRLRSHMYRDSEQAVTDARNSLVLMLSLFGATLLIAVGMAALVIRRVSGSLEFLAADMDKRIEQRDFSRELVLAGEDEVTELARAFNNLMQAYGRARDDLVLAAQRTEQLLEEHRENEKKIHLLFNGAPDGLLVIDSEGIITQLNTQVEKLFGYRQDELIGQPMEMLVPEASRGVHKQHRARYLEHPTNRQMGPDITFFGRRKDGALIPLSITLRVLETGGQRQIVSAIRDISELTAREAENRRMLRIIDATPDFVGTADAEGRLLYHNPAARSMIGLPPEADMSQMRIRDLYPEWAAQKVVEEGIPAAVQRGLWWGDTALLHHDGYEIPVSQVLMAHKDEQGRLQSLSTVMRDMTEARAAEAELIAAKQEAEAANQAKSAFLATMSHEIRTPLNAIIGIGSLLQREEMNDSQREKLNIIQGSSRNLLALINDILDLSKIEAGELALDPQPFSLKSLLDEVRALFEALMRDKGLQFAVLSPSPSCPPHFLGDDGRIRQMLVNLINNAMKFTDKGEVMVSTKLMELEGERALIRFAVQDSGIGISPEAQKRLFQPFSQADASTSRRYGGTGLGLSLVRQMAEQMGGRAGLESELGRGSLFWFELPLPSTEIRPPARDAMRSVEAIRVLIAEDDPTDRETLETQCDAFGWKMSSVADGLELLQRGVEGLQRGDAIDCLIVDWRMPRMDGAEAIRQLDQRLGDKPRPAIVMLTAGDAMQLAPLRESGLVDAVLTKPMDASSLFNQVNQAVVRHGRALDYLLAHTASLSDQVQWLPDLRVLVVDDVETNLVVARGLLEEEGAVVTTLRSGRDAIEELRQRVDRYDVVLMDVQMPELDGIQTTRIIRDELGLHQIPIIALTAGAMASDREAAIAAGMDAFVAKPIDSQLLIRTIRLRVEEGRSQPLPARPREEGWEPPPGAAARSGESIGEPDRWFDPEEGLRRLRGNKRIYHIVLDQFMSDIERFSGEMDGFLDADRFEDAARLCHSSKGLSRQLGSQFLGGYFEQWERVLKDQPRPEQIEPFRKDYQARCKQIRKQLEDVARDLD